MLKHSLLRYAVEKWRDAWKISEFLMTVEGLKKALTHLHYHVRLVAIATCASAAVNRPQEESIFFKSTFKLPPELQPLLLAALHDPERTIQMAAALCQYAIGRPSAHARDILRDILWQGESNSWAAAQCLAIEGEASQAVIERLLSQHFASSTMLDKQQAANLLVSISRKTTLVRSLLAEELNSANSSTRVLAFNKVLSTYTNNSIQALGKLAMGSVIHDELDKGPFSWRVEALVLMGQLKIMTAKLLPTFLRCLKDDFVVVRKQACLTAASLQIKDETILNQLIELTQNDPSCEVKEVAINTLRRIGCLTPSLQENLLWVLHHEEEPRVRIAVCQALKSLDVKGPELQNVLQEHIEELMKSNGYSLEGDKSMVHRITDQVRVLYLSMLDVMVDANFTVRAASHTQSFEVNLGAFGPTNL
uniref:Uncharacterized protein n=1 Tax=Electrophorus electricus TaxID=8005 RepID=A0A4W4GH57_ELEEL